MTRTCKDIRLDLHEQIILYQTTIYFNTSSSTIWIAFMASNTSRVWKAVASGLRLK
jgi:hypothetical protein